jgi:diacylglycerol kinase family enzyme
MPLGTGNDFSRSLGWGKEQAELVEDGFKELKRLVKDWSTAEVESLDVW